MTARTARVALSTVAAFVAALLLNAVLPPRAVAAVPRATHVGIVISQQRTACVTWHDGMTGADVLSAVASVQRRSSDGLINQIGGVPADKKVLPNYWAYWHNTGGGWAFSQVGADTYRPSAGSVEGWIYNNGSTPPASVGYAAICGSADAAAVPPAAPTRSMPAPTSTPARPKSTPPKAAPTSPAAANAPAGTDTPATASAPASHSTAAAAPASRGATPPPPATTNTSKAPSSAADPPDPNSGQTTAAALANVAGPPNTAQASNGQHPGPFVGIGVGAAAIVALGGASVWQRRRRAAHVRSADER